MRSQRNNIRKAGEFLSAVGGIKHQASSIQYRASSIEYRTSSIENRESSIDFCLTFLQKYVKIPPSLPAP